MRKTLYGYKQPRLVYLTPTTPTWIGKLQTSNAHGDGFLRLREDASDETLKNVAVYGKNYANEETWSRLKSISGSTVYVDFPFSNGLPAANTEIYHKYAVYDLPFTQSPLIETYDPDFIVHQLYNGTKDTTIRGWWYSVVLDYGKKLTAEQIEYFNDIFDSSRTTDVRLYPRKDNYAVYYTVEPDPSTAIQVANKPFWLGHRLFKVKLNGVTRLSAVNLSPTQFGIITESGDILTDEDGEVITP